MYFTYHTVVNLKTNSRNSVQDKPPWKQKEFIMKEIMFFFFVKVSDEPVVEGRKDDVNLKWINSVSYTMSGSDESKSDVLGLQQYI